MEYAVDLHGGEEFYASDTVSGGLIITFKQLFTMDPSDIDDIDFSDLVYSSLNEGMRNFTAETSIKKTTSLILIMETPNQ